MLIQKVSRNTLTELQCLDYIRKHYKALTIENVSRLQMEGAYYTKLMEPAASTFKQYLMKSNLQEPIIDVHSSVDGKQYRDKKDILCKLPKQMVMPMRWEQMMHILYKRPVGQYFPTTIECGPGNTLKTILKMVNAKAYDRCENVFD